MKKIFLLLFLFPSVCFASDFYNFIHSGTIPVLASNSLAANGIMIQENASNTPTAIKRPDICVFRVRDYNEDGDGYTGNLALRIYQWGDVNSYPSLTDPFITLNPGCDYMRFDKVTTRPKMFYFSVTPTADGNTPNALVEYELYNCIMSGK